MSSSDSVHGAQPPPAATLSCAPSRGHKALLGGVTAIALIAIAWSVWSLVGGGPEFLTRSFEAVGKGNWAILTISLVVCTGSLALIICAPSKRAESSEVKDPKTLSNRSIDNTSPILRTQAEKIYSLSAENVEHYPRRKPSNYVEGQRCEVLKTWRERLNNTFPFASDWSAKIVRYNFEQIAQFEIDGSNQKLWLALHLSDTQDDNYLSIFSGEHTDAIKNLPEYEEYENNAQDEKAQENLLHSYLRTKEDLQIPVESPVGRIKALIAENGLAPEDFLVRLTEAFQALNYCEQDYYLQQVKQWVVQYAPISRENVSLDALFRAENPLAKHETTKWIYQSSLEGHDDCENLHKRLSEEGVRLGPKLTNLKKKLRENTTIESIQKRCKKILLQARKELLNLTKVPKAIARIDRTDDLDTLRKMLAQEDISLGDKCSELKGQIDELKDENFKAIGALCKKIITSFASELSDELRETVSETLAEIAIPGLDDILDTCDDLSSTIMKEFQQKYATGECKTELNELLMLLEQLKAKKEAIFACCRVLTQNHQQELLHLTPIPQKLEELLDSIQKNSENKYDVCEELYQLLDRTSYNLGSALEALKERLGTRELDVINELCEEIAQNHRQELYDLAGTSKEISDVCENVGREDIEEKFNALSQEQRMELFPHTFVAAELIRVKPSEQLNSVGNTPLESVLSGLGISKKKR